MSSVDSVIQYAPMEICLTQEQHKDIRILGTFTEVWCRGHKHNQRTPLQLPGNIRPVQLCPECSAFLHYAVTKRLKCPLEAEKPSCKHCKIHCYAAEQRELAKQIMAWSGRRLLLRGRLDYLWHYFF